jgi:hypothetical protein
LISYGTKLTLVPMSCHCRIQTHASPILASAVQNPTMIWPSEGEDNHRVVGMDPMAKQTHLASSLIREVPTGLSHKDSAATGSSTNQTIHTSTDSAAPQSGCNIIVRQYSERTLKCHWGCRELCCGLLGLDTVQAVTHLPNCTVLQPGRSQCKRSPLGKLRSLLYFSLTAHVTQIFVTALPFNFRSHSFFKFL